MDQDPVGSFRFGLLLAWLIHPVTLVAVVLLAVNDHLLKAAYPGLLTGKLSDAVGLVVAPPVLALVLLPLLPRRSTDVLAATAAAVTATGFCAVKLSPLGAAVASAAWGTLTGPSVILADPTDLAVLPMLGVAWWTWIRARRRPVSRVAARRFGTLVALPAATLALVATSAPQYPDAVAVTSWRGLIVIGDADAYHGDRKPESWRVSPDGRHWRAMTDAELAEFDRVRATLPLTAQQSCAPTQPERCYRVVPGHLRVEQTSDGGATWSTSWQVPDERRGYLARYYDDVGDVKEDLASRALAVHPVPAGHVVIVANGRDGYARRDTSGRWERIAFGSGGSEIGYGSSDDPPPLAGGLGAVASELALAFLAGLLALGLGGWRAAGARATAAVFGIVLLGGVPLTLLGAVGLDTADFFVPYLGIFLLGCVVTLVGAVGAVVCAVRATVGRRWLVLVLLTAIGVVTGCAAPFVGWAAGAYGYRPAAYTAVLVAVVGVVLSVWSGGRAVRAPAMPAQRSRMATTP